MGKERQRERERERKRENNLRHLNFQTTAKLSYVTHAQENGRLLKSYSTVLTACAVMRYTSCLTKSHHK